MVLELPTWKSVCRRERFTVNDGLVVCIYRVGPVFKVFYVLCWEEVPSTCSPNYSPEV